MRSLSIVAWCVALAWVSRVVAARRGLPSIPDLRRVEYDRAPAGEPGLTVVVPARNEAAGVRACLESLVAQDYGALAIVAVDDRSTDATGAIMDELASAYPELLRVLHIEQLPAEWLGKTHAMALAAAQATTPFLLFTDGDVLFRPDALRRALSQAVVERADHLVLAPTTIIRRQDEAALLAFFQIFGLWAARPWRVANPRAMRDAIGIGAFNLLRRTAYEQVGGFEALRMEVVEDLGLARRVKRAGLRQRIVFGQGMVRVHWASGVAGLVGVMTKNVFSAFRFNPLLLLAGCGWLAVFCIGPFVTLFVPGLRLPALLAVVSIAYGYKLMSRASGLSPWNAVFAPLAAGVFVATLLRSMATTLRQGGVVWRGTFYPLAELRRHLAPMP